MSNDRNTLRDEVAEVACKVVDCMECEGSGVAVIAWRGDVPTYATCPVGLRTADALLPLLARRIEAARAEGEAKHRDLTSRLGFGDNITEPQADNDTIVAWFDQQGRDADEWVESQLWRNDCYAKGHPDDDDCFECDPAFAYERGLAEGEARIRARVEAVLGPVARSQYVSGRRGGKTFLGQFVNDLRAALAEPTGREGADAGTPPGRPETAAEPIGGVSGDSRGADEGTGAL